MEDTVVAYVHDEIYLIQLLAPEVCMEQKIISV